MSSSIVVHKTRQRASFWTALSVILIFLPILYIEIYAHQRNDFPDHIQFSRELVEAPERVPPHILAHPVYQALVAGVHLLTTLPYQAAALIVSLVIYMLIGLVLYQNFSSAWITQGKSGRFLAAAFPLAMMLVGPVALLAVYDQKLYFGYLGINIYHNPTINLLKPLALLGFLMVIRAFETGQSSPRDVWISAVVTVLSALAKPSYLICLLPAAGLLIAYRLVTRKPIAWLFFILGVFVPAGLVLGWQYLYTYNSADSGILFAPLQVMHVYSSKLAIKFFLSILFPLVLTLAYLREALRDLRMFFSWLAFGIGAGFTYLLAEGGNRFTDGNFAWSGEICLFILFVCAAVFFIGKKIKDQRWLRRDWIIAAALTAHLVSGLAYYVYSLAFDRFQ